MGAPRGLVVSWEGDPVVSRTPNGWRAELQVLPPCDEPTQVLKIERNELPLLKALVEGDPVAMELARAIHRRAEPGSG